MFPLKKKKRQWYSLLQLLLNSVLEVLDRAIREEKEIDAIKIGKQEVKLSLFADDMIPKNSTKSTKNVLEYWTTLAKW